MPSATHIKLNDDENVKWASTLDRNTDSNIMFVHARLIFTARYSVWRPELLSHYKDSRQKGSLKNGIQREQLQLLRLQIKEFKLQ